MKKLSKKKIVIIATIVLVGLLIFIIFVNRNQLVSSINRILGLTEKDIIYEVYSNESNKIKMILKFKDTEGISEIQLPDGDKLIADGKHEIGMDYVIEEDGEYTFVSKSTTGEEIRETINVNEEYRNNLIGIEKIQEISTEQDYSIIKKYDGESKYTYYYSIGENNTEWIQIPEYQIVNIDSYKVNELDWKNEDGTVTLKLKKVGTVGNTVEVKKKITDLNTAGIEFKEEERVLEGESIIACIRDNELESGNYRLKVNGEEYPAEIYNYEENVNYLTDKNLGTREADSRMLIMKYKGNLTVNQERMVTAETRKRGMFIYVAEELTNSGEISMTARGATAEGQDVYLWRHESGQYEYVPAIGAAGGTKIRADSAYYTNYVHVNGNSGKDGKYRKTGGGGSGAASAYNLLWAVSGNGSNGTSYSGGTGGASGYASVGAKRNGSDGEANGGAGGAAGANGGTGNPGGAPNGTNGTGGLLIIYSNKFNNNNKINANGVNSNGLSENGDNVNNGGGASGGGSINIFYNELINVGTVEAIRGKGRTGGIEYDGAIAENTLNGSGGSGGHGGDGCVTLQDINIKLPTIIVDELTYKSFKVKITDSNQPREGIEYDYYVNDEIKISKSSLLEETIGGLNPETEYRVKIRAYYDGVTELFSNEVIIKTQVLAEEIFVATNGDDTTGDGTELKPYASVDKAIEEAISGQKIHILEGTYNLKPMYSNGYIDSAGHGQDGYAQAGINDQNKKLEIYGENEKTILVYDGALSSKREAPAVSLHNEESILRNVTYIFKPKNGYNYARAIFRWCNGTVNNVFFRISGKNKASYLYHNAQKVPNNVINCTFFHDLFAVDDNYSGSCNLKNIATNVRINGKNPNGTNTNVIIQNFGSATTELTELIENSRANESFISYQVGVFYGTNAWR